MEKMNLHSLRAAISGPLAFNFVPFTDSFGICAGLIGRFYDAESTATEIREIKKKFSQMIALT